jgi:hypothetical protein
MAPRPSSAQVRQAAVAGCIVAGLASGAVGDYGDTAGSDSVLVPADWAFGIWGPIYLGSLSYGVVQALPSEADDEELVRIAWPAAVGYLGAGLWIRVAGRPGWYVLVATTSAAAATLAHHRLHRGPDREGGGRRQLLVRAPVGAFAGWLTLAAAVSLPEPVAQLLRRDVRRFEQRVALPLLGATSALVAIRSLRVQATAAYPLAVAWGLAGTAIRQRDANRPVAAAAAAASAVLAGVAARQTTRRSVPRPDPR